MGTLFHVKQFDPQGFGCIEVDIPLGEGDDDSGIPENLVDTKTHPAFNDTSFNDAFDRNPEVRLENQRVVTEIGEQYKWFRFFMDRIEFIADLKQQYLDLLDV
jgi:hypothetical protein